jgi:hypothetical protein
MTGSAAYATCPRFTEAARRCEAPAAVVGVAGGGAQGGRAAASPDRETQRPNTYGRQASKREREREHEQVLDAAPEADQDGCERGGVQRPGVQWQAAPINVNCWQGRGRGASAPAAITFLPSAAVFLFFRLGWRGPRGCGVSRRRKSQEVFFCVCVCFVSLSVTMTPEESQDVLPWCPHRRGLPSSLSRYFKYIECKFI